MIAHRESNYLTITTYSNLQFLVSHAISSTRLQPKDYPGTGQHADALHAFETLKSGGIVIGPSEVGYGLLASSSEAVQRAFAAKRRKPGHAQGIIGTYNFHREIHLLDERRFEMIRVLTQHLDMSFGVVAPFKVDHARLKNMTAETLANATKGDTMAMFVGGGSFLNELGRLNDEDGQVMVGSSANVSGQGQKFRVGDIEDEIKDAVDLIVDYGLQRYHTYGRASINFDFGNMSILRMGACYELFRERMRRFWGVELPEDPEYKS